MLISGCAAIHDVKSVRTEVLFSGKYSIRAIEIVGEKVWYGAENGKYGYYDLPARKAVHDTIDGVKTEFRSIASNNGIIYLLNAGSPATLYEIDGKVEKLVHRDSDPAIFYDSMRFLDTSNAIAVGDPIGGCFTLLASSDGGGSWTRQTCANSPKNVDGEAAFAASNGNIAVHGEEVWFVSGGKASRLFNSADKGKSWRSFETPIVQGKEMTGAFSCDFYDSKNGIIAGGDYEKPTSNVDNKAVTKDGGRTWQLISQGTGFGYCSSVRYVPGSDARQIVSVGPTGIWWSGNRGKSWSQVSADPDFYTIRFIDSKTAIAAGKGKMVKISF